jgi:hypothetical protein
MLTRLLLSAAAILASMRLSSHAQDAPLTAELAPTGALRVGLIEAPSAGLIFVSRAADGKPEGVTADLSADLAWKVGLPHAVTLFPNSGAAAVPNGLMGLVSRFKRAGAGGRGTQAGTVPAGPRSGRRSART